MLDPEQTVEQLVRKYPQTIQVFISLRMDCVGCSFMRFCSLANAAKDYKLDINTLITGLEKAIVNDLPNNILQQ